MTSWVSVDRRRLSSIADPVTNIFHRGGQNPIFFHTGCAKCCVKFWSVLDDPLTLTAHVCVVCVQLIAKFVSFAVSDTLSSSMLAARERLHGNADRVVLAFGMPSGSYERR